jgi:hypothetical protein
MKFGKKPYIRNRYALALSNYGSASKIAFPPVCAYERPIDYQMLGNDSLGLCFEAGIWHQRMTWKAVANAGSPLLATTDLVVADYSAITGYDPSNPATDQGTDPNEGFAFYKANKVLAGYAALDLNNIDQLKGAIYTFGGMGLGIVVPQSMVDQINQGIDPTWEFLPNDKPTNQGHYIYVSGYGRNGVAIVSWGKVYHARWDFVSRWADQAEALIGLEWLKQSGRAPSGLDLAGLLADSVQGMA